MSPELKAQALEYGWDAANGTKKHQLKFLRGKGYLGSVICGLGLIGMCSFVESQIYNELATKMLDIP